MKPATRMWALDGPTFTLDSGLLMCGGSGEVTIPIPAFLIEHPKGLVLFDTGIVPAAADDPKGVYGELAEMFQLQYSREQRVDHQIEALGFRCEDIKHVILSHAHDDHAGGLYLFPDADFYIGQGELPYAMWPSPGHRGFFRPTDIELARNFRWREIPGCDHDLFGDGAITMLWTPGHTLGELSLRVRLPNQTFILAGDTVHLREALNGTIPAPFDVDASQSVASIRRLQLLQAAEDANVWINHDPDDWAFYGAAPEFQE